MSQVQNLWPADFGGVKQKTPVSILREQGRALGERTKNIVVGRVESRGGGGDNVFEHFLHLYCSPLGYQMPLLLVQHGIDLYPATITVYGPAGQESSHVDTPEEFTARLKEIFAQEGVKKMIASLLAQSEE